MTRQRPVAGLALLAVAALAVGGAWQLATALGRSDAAASLVFVAAALVIVVVVGIRSRDWTETPYW